MERVNQIAKRHDLVLTRRYSSIQKGCITVDGRIYCYGGYNYTNATSQPATLSDFYYLNVSKEFNLETGLSSWFPVEDFSLFSLDEPGSNAMFGFVPVHGMYGVPYILMQGGVGPGNGSAMPSRTYDFLPTISRWNSLVWDGSPLQTQVQLEE